VSRQGAITVPVADSPSAKVLSRVSTPFPSATWVSGFSASTKSPRYRTVSGNVYEVIRLRASISVGTVVTRGGISNDVSSLPENAA